MAEPIVKLETAKLLKEIGFNLPVPHCFIHDEGEEYYLELFSYFLGGEGHLSDVYNNEKEIRGFNRFGISNESETHFDYNQDIRKLLARFHNTVEYMNDPSSYNMNIDSHTYGYWDSEKEAQMKIELPNYNDGDFDFSVYQDVISAPTQALVQKFLRDTHNINVCISFKPNIKKWDYISYNMNLSGKEYVKFCREYTKLNNNRSFETYEDALEVGLIEGLMLIKSNK